jgi:predicted DNA-binding transcriptional regulator AlpA
MKEETGDKLALGINEFCRRHDISRGFFYKLEKQGRAPRTVQLGTRRLIMIEDADQWRAERMGDQDE